MNNQREVAVLYSGGTDSTCAAAIMAEKFEIIHLLTFKRLGFSFMENTRRNVELLKKKFSSTIFIHKIIDVDYVARYINYNNFVRDIVKYGFFALSNCLVCCLVNHFGALIYCLDKEIKNIADGTTKDWLFFPSHMEKVILSFREIYAKFKINYYTPVYNFDILPPVRFIDKIYAIKLQNTENHNADYSKNTTGNYLYKLGLFSSNNVKGTDFDRKMQPRCLQFILHHIYIYGYFMLRHDYTDFELITLKFIREKSDNLLKLVKEKDTVFYNNYRFF